jgi:hypothetical protein
MKGRPRGSKGIEPCIQDRLLGEAPVYNHSFREGLCTRKPRREQRKAGGETGLPVEISCAGSPSPLPLSDGWSRMAFSLLSLGLGRLSKRSSEQLMTVLGTVKAIKRTGNKNSGYRDDTHQLSGPPPTLPICSEPTQKGNRRFLDHEGFQAAKSQK